MLDGKGACVDKPELVNDSISIVLIGKFQPLQVTPRWLRQMDLIGAEDFDSYTVEIISPGATIVSFGSIRLQVGPENLQILAGAPAEVEVARDLAAGILLSSDDLSISAMGINRMVHFKADLKEYHAIGDALTPKNQWNGVLNLPGMQSLAMTGIRDDGHGGSINVVIQPSAVLKPGVFVSVNDHYSLTFTETRQDRNTPPDPSETDPQPSRDKVPVAVKILTDGFNVSRHRAQAIIDLVASLGIPGGT
jgi:hypothetical protein